MYIHVHVFVLCNIQARGEGGRLFAGLNVGSLMYSIVEEILKDVHVVHSLRVECKLTSESHLIV